MDRPRATNLTMYTLCGISSILSAWPSYQVINIGLLLTFVVLIIAYLVRSRSLEDSLVHHHMTFVIRTLWIYSAFATVCMLLAGYLIYTKGDQTAFTGLMDQVNSGVVPSEDDLNQIEAAYLSTNMGLIIESYLTCMFPALLYLVWRVSRGASRAHRNFRVQSLYSWI